MSNPSFDPGSSSGTSDSRVPNSIELPELATDSMRPRSTLPPTEFLGRSRPPVGDRKTKDQAIESVLVEKIAEGGMGEVWEGVQSSLGRTVAIKKIRSELLVDDRREQSLSAFRQEAIVAASLEHPNIVPVHELEDRGPNSSPRLLMKRVRGVAWTEPLAKDFRGREIEQFLATHLPILVDVANAVAFAHSRGVVHRDLKPSQVMVGEFGEVLLMDWGLSVFVGGTLETESGFDLAALARPHSAPNPIGTPALMAPEQTDENSLRIGPWTDVYLLGGILYLLLTGRFPHGTESSRSSFERAARGTVVPPSERSPNRAIPAELERLCLDAMAREPDQRSLSAAEFSQRLKDFSTGATRRRRSTELARRARERADGLASDLDENYRAREEIGRLYERSLRAWPDNPEAIAGRASNLAERTREEIARGDVLGARLHLHRLREIPRVEATEITDLEHRLEGLERAEKSREIRKRAIGVSVVLLLVAFCGAIWRSVHEAGQRELFEQINQLHAAEAELEARLDAVLPLPDRVPGVSSLSREQVMIDRQLAMALLRDRASLRRERDRLQSQSVAELRAEPYALLLGEANLAYHTADEPTEIDRALQLYREAGRIRPELPEADIGRGLSLLRRGDLAAGAQVLEEAAAAMASVRGPQHIETGRALALSGDAWRRVDRSSVEAIEKYEESLSILEPQWVELTSTLAERLHVLGRFDQALEYSRLAETAAASFEGTDHALQVGAKLQTVENLLELERLEDAETVIHEVLSNQELDQTRLPAVLKEMAVMLRKAGRLEEALATLDRGLALVEQQATATPLEAQFLNNRGLVLRSLGRAAEAESDYRQSIALAERLQGTDHPDLATTLYNLGRLLRELERLDEAAPLMRRSLGLFEAVLGVDHPDLSAPLSGLGLVLAQLEQFDEAESTLRRSLELSRATFGAEHVNAAKAMVNLGRILSNLERFPEAIEMCEQASRILETGYHAEHRWVGIAQDVLGTVFREAGQLMLSEAALRRALEIRTKILGLEHPEVGLSSLGLAKTLIQMNRSDEATPLLEDASRILAARYGSEDRRTIASVELLRSLD